MKKVMSILLACLLLIAAAGCAKNEPAAPSNLAGTYYCTSMTIPGLTMNPMEMGIEIQLHLQDDGTGTLSFVTGEIDCPLTWSADGENLTLTVEGYTRSTLERADDSLTLHLEDESGAQDMVFVKH